MERITSGVVAFGFGEPAQANPNTKLAERARSLSHEGGLTVFTDRDVSPHLEGKVRKVHQIDPNRVPTTFRLALLAMWRAKEDELNTLYVVAAPCHMWRCLRDLRWAATEYGVDVTLIPCPIVDYQYDWSATTLFTRSAWVWWPFEVAYRITSMLFPCWYKHTRA